jgi:hypothetical protein
MSVEFFCVFCRKPIAGNKKRSARYCGLECRNSVLAARRKEGTLRNRNHKEMIVKVHEDWLTKFHDELLTWAIPEAGGYQVGLWIGQMTYWFPSMPEGVKLRNTLLRTRSRDSFFSLDPFEPPTVPLIAEYQIRFVQKIPPHPVLPIQKEMWRKWIPYAVPIRPLPFNLRAVPRDRR